MLRRYLLAIVLVSIAGCESPTQPGEPDRLDPVQRLALGSNHACKLDEEGVASCWGANGMHQLGVTTPLPGCPVSCSNVPIPVETPARFSKLAGAGEFTCGITGEGEAICWGSFPGSQVWNGSPPTSVAPGLRFASFSAGSALCGSTFEGSIYCWGSLVTGYDNPHIEESRFSSVPRRVESAERFTLVSAASRHACALTRDGTAYCWGSNEFGELGSDLGSEGCWYHRGSTTLCSTTAKPVAGGLKFRSISVVGGQSCGVTVDGGLHCWGRNTGNSGPDYGASPAPVMPEHRFRDVIVGSWQTCAITEAGPTYCWGSGWLGNGVFYQQTTGPVEVAGGHSFRTVRMGSSFNCGLTDSGEVYCWGWNDAGQLGNGEVCRCIQVSPVRVATMPRET